MSYSSRIRERGTELYNFLEIYTIPDLNLVQNYEFPNPGEGPLYMISSAIQLKSGNILAIYDKLYEFDGENIKEGPTSSSGKLGSSYFNESISIEYYDKKGEKVINKRLCKQSNYTRFLEVKENKILFTLSPAICVNLVVAKDKNAKAIEVISNTSHEKNFDIILASEYYPENVYVVENNGCMIHNASYSSKLFIFNLDEFVAENTKKRKPLSEITISESEFTFSLLEYDKKYLLCDTIAKGIYIFDMDTKTKVALCDVKRDVNYPQKNFIIPYKMIKLESGHVLHDKGVGHFGIVDIKAGEEKEFGAISEKAFFVKDNYMIATDMYADVSVIRLFDA